MMNQLTRYKYLLLVVPALLVLVLALHGPGPAAAQPPKQNGFNYVAYFDFPYGRPQATQAMRDLKDTGANWVSIVVTQFQLDYTSTTFTNEVIPEDPQLRKTIRDAKALGLKVMLKPHLNLQEGDEWHGQIGERFTTEAQWNAWFGSYQAFINKYARIAKEEGVDQFAVGTELSGTQFRDRQWRDTISGVRAIYKGPLTYAANFDAALTVPWWDAVDFIGIDAYYNLTNKLNPTRAELANGWKRHIADLESLQKRVNRPVIFTEVGWVTIDGANQQFKNNIFNPGRTDLQEHADLYHSVLTGIYNKPWFAGLFFWTWSPDPFEGGICDRYWTPYDKPAEAIVRQVFGAPPRQPNVFPDVDESVSRVIYGDAPASGWFPASWNGMNANFSATNQVHSGSRSISAAAADSWAGLGVFHNGIDTTPYHFLEFYLRLESAATEIYVTINDRNEEPIISRSLEDCRYTSDVLIEGKKWTRVRIPLEHLYADNQTITGIAFSVGNTPGRFNIDDVRLVGAKGGGSGSSATFIAAEDSYTSEAQQTKAFGKAKVLRVKNTTKDFNTYLKFNVSGLAAPVSRATLRLFVSDTSDNSGAVFAVGNGWTETGLKWQNAPAISGSPVAAAKSAAAKQYIEFDVTDAISGNGTFSFAVSGGSANQVGFVSREGKQKPELVIETGP